MLKSQFILPMHDELIVDLFAGGGGASTGIELAIGRHVDIAVNHDPEAVAQHEMNHPQTRHFCEDVFDVDPREVTEGRPVGLLWASPDCKHFSKAKGGKPVSKKIRSLAWVVVKWAKLAQPRMIFLENVEEFQTWGPLGADGLPCPARKGMTFRRWIRQLEGLGYVVEWRELRACDFGAPTTRKRLYLIARRDGEPIAWPSPTHGPGLKPYRTAAECIDWTIPTRSIFERDRPLAENTLRRIARGVMRYVVTAAKPFVVHIAHGEGKVGGVKRWGSGTHDVDKPMPTITTKAEHVVAVPSLAPLRGTSPSHTSVHDVGAPLSTVSAGGTHHALVAAFLAKHYGGNETPGSSLDRAMDTITTQDHHALVTAQLVPGQAANDSGQPEQLGHAEKVHALLLKFYGNDKDGAELGGPMHTITTRDRFALVMVAGEPYAITDIGMRMLEPRELYRAQGFPASYVIDKRPDGSPLPKTSQVRMVGNSVSPVVACAIVGANFAERSALKVAA